METIKDVLYFLNELDFTDKVDNDCLEKFVEVKKMLLREVEVYKTSKMIYSLNIIDEIKLSDMTNDLDHRFERIDYLRSVNFYLISFKHLADTNIHGI